MKVKAFWNDFFASKFFRITFYKSVQNDRVHGYNGFQMLLSFEISSGRFWDSKNYSYKFNTRIN